VIEYYNRDNMKLSQKEFDQYQHVQDIAKETINYLRGIIKEGITEKEIVEKAENYLYNKNVESFWYYNIGAFVFVGTRTVISMSGREYQPSDVKIQTEDIVTIDLSPAINSYWGDYARSFIISKGQVVGAEIKDLDSKCLEFIEGMKIEELLHKKFLKFTKEEHSFEEIYTEMNLLIQSHGYENLDFIGNLGHTIEKYLDKRKYFEIGNKTKLSEVDLFTFEPHIRRINGKYGFKRENIYYFQNNTLKTL
jgi:methionine aminopeptidase